MKRILMLVLFMSGLVNIVCADTRTVKLSVPSMNCAMCPITVRKALEKVDGVTQANADYETKSVIVTFDNQKVTIDDLTKATKDAGYPSIETKPE